MYVFVCVWKEENQPCFGRKMYLVNVKIYDCQKIKLQLKVIKLEKKKTNSFF